MSWLNPYVTRAATQERERKRTAKCIVSPNARTGNGRRRREGGEEGRTYGQHNIRLRRVRRVILAQVVQPEAGSNAGKKAGQRPCYGGSLRTGPWPPLRLVTPAASHRRPSRSQFPPSDSFLLEKAMSLRAQVAQAVGPADSVPSHPCRLRPIIS